MENKNKLRAKTVQTRQDGVGKLISYFCIGLIGLLVLSIIFFIAVHGLTIFFKDGVSLKDFFSGQVWNPGTVNTKGVPQAGALPMIVTSFSVTILAALVATPFALSFALFITEIAPKRVSGLLQSVIELLVGVPSVVYGFVGLSIVVPFVRSRFGGTGSGILSAVLVLFVMILPTITSLSIDSLKNVPASYRDAALALGSTRWQTISKIILRSAVPGILTAVIFGMARAFGEALAVQMVIGNAPIMPTGLTSPAATLTSTLTVGIGNTVLGTPANDALWSLALVLLLMSLLFNVIVKVIGRRGGKHA